MTIMKHSTFQRRTLAAIFLVALIAAAVSFIHIFSLALAHHQPVVAAALYPVSVDALIATVWLSMYQAAKEGRDPHKGAQATLLLAVLATLAANFAYGFPFGLISAVISCWPAVAFLCGFEVALAGLKHESQAARHVIKKINHPSLTLTQRGQGYHVVTPAQDAGPAASPAGTQNGSGGPQAPVRVRKARKKAPLLTAAQAEELAEKYQKSTRTIRTWASNGELARREALERVN